MCGRSDRVQIGLEPSNSLIQSVPVSLLLEAIACRQIWMLPGTDVSIHLMRNGGGRGGRGGGGGGGGGEGGDLIAGAGS